MRFTSNLQIRLPEAAIVRALCAGPLLGYVIQIPGLWTSKNLYTAGKGLGQPGPHAAHHLLAAPTERGRAAAKDAVVTRPGGSGFGRPLGSRLSLGRPLGGSLAGLLSRSRGSALLGVLFRGEFVPC